MNQSYVAPLLFPRLATHRVGHVGASSLAGQACGRKALGLASRLRQAKGGLHEDQLREPRSRSRVNRFADEPLHRRYDAAVQGQFVTLDQRTEPRRGQVRLGTWIWSVLGFGVRCFGSLCLHREAGRTSSETGFCRGTKAIRRTLRTRMAKGQGMKLLKQFHSSRPIHTPLKRGVNERTAITSASYDWLRPCVEEISVNQTSREDRRAVLINTRFQPGVGKRMNSETVLTVSRSHN